jgi:hypothetical protein
MSRIIYYFSNNKSKFVYIFYDLHIPVSSLFFHTLCVSFIGPLCLPSFSYFSGSVMIFCSPLCSLFKKASTLNHVPFPVEMLPKLYSYVVPVFTGHFAQSVLPQLFKSKAELIILTSKPRSPSSCFQ